MNIIQIIIDKLSQYNFLTNILPGTVLCLIIEYVVGYHIINDDIYLSYIMFYFAGIVNSRFGSLVVEPLLKKARIVKFEEYDRFVQAENKDPKITMLSQETNVYRSYLSVMCLTLLLLGFNQISMRCQSLQQYADILLVSLLFVLFLLSYIKQIGYVKKRICVNLDTKTEKDESSSTLNSSNRT